MLILIKNLKYTVFLNSLFITVYYNNWLSSKKESIKLNNSCGINLKNEKIIFLFSYY